MKIKEFIIEMIDENNIVLNNKVLTEMFDVSEKELELLIPSHLKNENILLIREPDADEDNGYLVDCSTYFIKIKDHYIDNKNLAKEIFSEVRTVPEYISAYESY